MSAINPHFSNSIARYNDIITVKTAIMQQRICLGIGTALYMHFFLPT